MTLKVKLLLVGLACLGLGSFTVHYQIFRSQQAERLRQLTQTEQRSVEWVAEILEHRVEQMEAAVSYLDKSTVESLRRLGVRYFVYAHKQGQDWRLKWKMIDTISEEELLSEANKVNFDELSTDRRTWQQPTAEKLALLVPVNLASSLQLKEGFLLFGLRQDFFDFIRERDGVAQIFNPKGEALFRVLGQLPLPKSWIPNLIASPETKTVLTNDHALTAYLSAKVDAWVVRPTPYIQKAFLTDSQGRYFLVWTFFLMGLYILLLWTWSQGEWGLSSLAQVPARLKAIRQLRPRADQRSYDEGGDLLPVVGLSTAEAELDAFDLSHLLSEFVNEEDERLRAIGIQLKTQFPEKAEIVGSALHLRDFLRRLIGNSALTLVEETEKRIELQVIEQSSGFQLIYLDSRSKSFPDATGTSLLLQTEGSLTGIDGIIAYATWYFGDHLHVARQGFCLSLDLPRGGQNEATASRPAHHEPETETPHEDFNQFNLGDFSFLEAPGASQEVELNPAATPAEKETSSGKLKSPVDLEELDTFLQTSLSQLDFKPAVKEVTPSPEVRVEANQQGLFEFKTGDFKIKIRAPRKKDKDVNF